MSGALGFCGKCGWPVAHEGCYLTGDQAEPREGASRRPCEDTACVVGAAISASEWIATELESICTEVTLREYAADAGDESASPSLHQYEDLVRTRLGGDYSQEAWDDAMALLVERYADRVTPDTLLTIAEIHDRLAGRGVSAQDFWAHAFGGDRGPLTVWDFERCIGEMAVLVDRYAGGAL